MQIKNHLLVWVGLLLSSPVTYAQSVNVTVDTDLAGYILDLACSGQAVDEERLRNSRFLQAQIRHHSGNSDRFSMDGFIEAARKASNCEVPEPDLYRFRFVVEERESVANAVAFLKEHEAELADYVREKTAPYFPADMEFTGEIVMVTASWSCGGFSMDGAFFVDVPCVAAAIQDEFEAVKILSAHETYHALQYAFFAPFSEDIDPVESPDQALAYLFLTLLLEGTAEYVADSRDVPGEGRLASIFRRFAERSYRRLDSHYRWLDYTAAILAVDEASNLRIREVYQFGFTGDNDQKFYYVGATMARVIEVEFGRESLVCIMALSPEQFVLAYHAAFEASDRSTGYPLGPSVLGAAQSLAKSGRTFENCR